MTNDDEHIYMEIYPPLGCIFRLCDLCDNPYVDDGLFNNCLWCEINKEEKQNMNKFTKEELTDVFFEHSKKEQQLDKMTLREVMEYTKNMSIQDGGFVIMIERLVREIETLKGEKTNDYDEIIHTKIAQGKLDFPTTLKSTTYPEG